MLLHIIFIGSLGDLALVPPATAGLTTESFGTCLEIGASGVWSAQVGSLPCRDIAGPRVDRAPSLV